MKSAFSISLAIIAAAVGIVEGQIGKVCDTPYGSGTCQTTTTCHNWLDLSVPGYCPGPTDIQCCLDIACDTPRGDGWCMNTDDGGCPGGSYVRGYCPGPDNFECCVG